MSRSYWYRFTKLTTGHAWVAALTCLLPLAAVAPAAYQVLRLEVSSDTTQVCPRDADSIYVLNLVQGAFPPGAVTPLNGLLLADPAKNNSIMNEAFFQNAYKVTAALAKRTGSDAQSIACVNGTQVSLAAARVLLGPVTACKAAAAQLELPPSLCTAYRALYAATVNVGGGNTSILVPLQSAVNPWGKEFGGFVRTCRAVLDTSSHTSGAYLAVPLAHAVLILRAKQLLALFSFLNFFRGLGKKAREE